MFALAFRLQPCGILHQAVRRSTDRGAQRGGGAGCGRESRAQDAAECGGGAGCRGTRRTRGRHPCCGRFDEVRFWMLKALRSPPAAGQRERSRLREEQFGSLRGQHALALQEVIRRPRLVHLGTKATCGSRSGGAGVLSEAVDSVKLLRTPGREAASSRSRWSAVALRGAARRREEDGCEGPGPEGPKSREGRSAPRGRSR